MKDIRVKVNSNRSSIDYQGDYRAEFAERISSTKVDAMKMSYSKGVLRLTQYDKKAKDGLGRSFSIPAKNIAGIMFCKTDDKAYAEIVVANGNGSMSFTLSPTDT